MPSGMPEAGLSSREPSSEGTRDDRVSYVVQAGETMNAIAAKFDLTPSELARLNRIPTNSMLFPGRKLSIPVKQRRRESEENNPLATKSADDSSVVGFDKSAPASDDKSATNQQGAADSANDNSDKSNQQQTAAAAQVGDAHQSKVPINNQQNDLLSGLMIPPRASASGLASDSGSGSSALRGRISNVLKINARHITDGQGVVTGTLLITPNNIMFSPNVSDLIVIEHGTEHYEVTAPIDMIAGAALYTDIAMMRTKMHQKPIVCNIPVQVYYSEEQRPKTPPSTPNKLSTGDSNRPASDSEGSQPVSVRPTKTPPSSPIVGRQKYDQSRTSGSTTSTATTISTVSESSTGSTSSGPEPARSDSRDIEEPEVFAALEKLIPKPVQPQENSMLYLCLRMGKPMNKVVKTPAVSLGRRKLKCEYWFGIPRNRVDEVYKFFQRNYPEKYGDVIELNMKERGFDDIESDDDDGDGVQKSDDGGKSSSTGKDANKSSRDEGNAGVAPASSSFFGGVGGSSGDDSNRQTPDTPSKSSADGALTGVLNRVGSFKNPFKLPRFFEGPNTPHPSFSSCEWEVIALKDDSNAAAATAASNLLNPLTPDEILLPEMVDDSEILDEEHRKMLYKVIPARADGYAWRLVYSTTRNGFSLKTFYREMSRHDGPVLLAITDTEGALFGAFASTTIHPSDHFYGTGEMFLWSFHPTFNKFSWSGENQYFIKGNPDSLVFGSGDGEFGLYLDGDLYHGRSSPCKTFNNDVLSKTNDFVIKSLEAWGFF